jgi:hypothetical protein
VQPSPSISLLFRQPADRPAAIPNLPGPQPISREYRRLPRAQTQWSDIIRSHPVDNTDNVSERRHIMPLDGHLELNRESNTPTHSTVLEVQREQAPELVPTPQLDPPRSTSPVTQPSLPDIDIRTSVATEEARIDAIRQAAATFYHDAPVGTTSSSGRIQQRPSYPLYRRRSGTTRAADEQLMLFREPPPWSALEDTRIAASATGTKDKQRIQEHAVLGRSGTTGAAGMKELLQMIKRRKLSETTTKVVNLPKTVTNPISRNPFRRDPEDPEDLAHAPAQNSADKKFSSISRPPLVTMPAAARLNSVVDDPARPFKPISTLPVSALPELRSTQAKVVQVSSASLAKKSIKKAKPANVGTKGRYPGPLPSLLQAAPSKPAPSQNPRISVKPSDNTMSRRKTKGPAPFDWKGWSEK